MRRALAKMLQVQLFIFYPSIVLFSLGLVFGMVQWRHSGTMQWFDPILMIIFYAFALAMAFVGRANIKSLLRRIADEENRGQGAE